jgi:signal transduction histidine kinase
MVTHELRTPINAVIGWAAILRRAPATDHESFAQALDSIERNARLQAVLIKDLLDMSRIVAGQLQLEKQRLALATVIDAAINVVRPAAEAKQICLHIEKMFAPVYVSGDAARLQQVLWNLLSNAIKFTPEHGRVEIKLETYGAQAQVSVSDTGKGIRANFLPFVFDRFRQDESCAATRHEGLGLGLAIARHLVQLHGGVIDAASQGENLGSTFTIRLPLLAADPIRPLEAQPAFRAMAAQ